jgi:hypothetical protein
VIRLARFMNAAARHLGAKVATSPDKAVKASSDPLPSLTPSNPAQKTIMQKFVRSPLAAASLTATQVDALDTVFGDALVQRAAGHLQLRRARLLELAGFRSAIAEAISAAGEPAQVTPEKVVAILSRLTVEIDDEIDAFREDRAQHDARHKARLDRRMPLRHAISIRVSTLTTERETCIRHIDASRRASSMSGHGLHRYSNLRATGLSDEQIKTLGPDCQSPEDQEATIKRRIALIDAELAPLLNFSASGDLVCLNGLGLDAVIAQAYPDRASEGVAA